MNEEVRFQMLRPGQIQARREACPVVYIPLGILEWHGLYNPMGADGLQAEGLAVACARKGGGVVFPTLYYGENRAEALMDTRPDTRGPIADCMGLPHENFQTESQPFTVTEQTYHYAKLLMQILYEAEAYGFKVGVFVAGHYPLIDHAKAAVLLHNQRRQKAKSRMLAWAFSDYLLVKGEYAVAGDHGGGWETSHLLSLHPETVDMTLIPPKGQPLTATGGRLHRADATAKFGSEIIDKAADAALKEVLHRAANPEIYFAHGMCLAEGLWKKTE